MVSNETAAACSAALDYVRHGWSVIPVAPDAKRPSIMWLDFQRRLPTERNSTIASLAGHLLWHGVDPFVALDLLLYWNATRCRPPLPEHEVVRTIESIARLHLRDEQTRRELR